MAVLLHGSKHYHNLSSGEKSCSGHYQSFGSVHEEKFKKIQRVSISLKDNSNKNLETFKTVQSINVRAAFIHVVGDFLQSLGVLIAAYIIYYHVLYIRKLS